MIPLLAVPVINRPDLFRAMLDSIDHPIGRLLVIDNSPDSDMPCPAEATIIEAPWNLGVAASWNLALRAMEGWCAIANADTVFAPGALARLEQVMEDPSAKWVGMDGDWRCFGINAATVAEVGMFDENFYPIYCEDADYERRCWIAGVPFGTIQTGSTHTGSAAIRSGYGQANATTFPANVLYYKAKWGGSVRGGERYRTPFDRGGSIREWTLDLSRLRRLSWSRFRDDGIRSGRVGVA